ncbi:MULTISPECIES: hypothetical protein [Bacillaceae]|nr:hypothetical protein [Bacillus cereus group sp. BfR-BA-01700]EEL78772.1 hypothetical protein bcere0028_56010 [Bacillus cereus AH1271]MDX5841142.1 hypothetical protein [Bacillus cereus group sp. BfR-BA-01700]
MEQSELSLFVIAVIIGGMMSFVYWIDVMDKKITRLKGVKR